MKHGGLDDIHEIVTLLRDAKRETDMIGYLGGDLIGLLLTDTDEQGAQGFVRKLATRARDNGFSTITKTYPGEHLASLVAQGQERPGPHIQPLESPVRAAYRVKRCLDIIGSIIAMVLLSPVMLITALAVAATSPGPVILKQVRLGKKGVPFVFYKFRSMVANSDDGIHRQYVTSLINGDLEGINQGNPAKPLYKIEFDPRVTRVGRFIRKTSIDELPQLFNVLKGDMSLVGPRPPLPYEAENYQSWHLRRILEAKPGMTGLWQVEGRSKISFDEMVRRDLRYIQSCSLLLDLRILFKTIKVVLRCEGAT
jgi:lipopolysaccharide/colanic/teichoic acid biosynthesis glycosyltransferase